MCKNLMTAIFSFVVVGLLICGGAGVAKAQSEDTKKEFETIYAEIDKLAVEKNVAAIEGWLAPDFTTKRNGKEMSREEYLKLQAQAAKNIKDITVAESEIEDLDVSEDGEIIIKSSQQIKAVVIKDGKEVEIEIVNKSIDKWVKTEKGWKLTYTEDLDDK